MWVPGAVILYHFTCAHGDAGIQRDGYIKPMSNREIRIPEPVVWLSSSASAQRRALGLTSHTLKCDRMEHLYRVNTADAVPWSNYRLGLSRFAVMQLEAVTGTRPMLWWLSETPLSDIERIK